MTVINIGLDLPYPGGYPYHADCDRSGALQSAIECFSAGRATDEQLALLRDYALYVLQAPAWAFNNSTDRADFLNSIMLSFTAIELRNTLDRLRFYGIEIW